jgi:mannosyltransferase OCH1-like enzyme
MIPKQIFQTHKSIEFIQSQTNLNDAVNSWRKYSLLPGFPHAIYNKLMYIINLRKRNYKIAFPIKLYNIFLQAINKFKNYKNKVFKYYFFDNQMCDDFMKQHFSGEIYDCYSKLPVAVMKADLWRYCVIYKNGGIYADADTICKFHPFIFTNNNCLLCLVPENKDHLCQWVFSAPPNSPILKTIIDLSIERIKQTTELKDEHFIHYLTGPGVFTDGIVKYLQKNNCPTFENKKLFHNYPDNVLKVFNYDNFHKNIVTHLFTGQSKGGWCEERDNLFT